jgi:Skp family chaperone for outer membrane proteins
MSDNSISILLDKKNIFIASKNYDITKNLITLIDKDIKSIDIE